MITVIAISENEINTKNYEQITEAIKKGYIDFEPFNGLITLLTKEKIPTLNNDQIRGIRTVYDDMSCGEYTDIKGVIEGDVLRVYKDLIPEEVATKKEVTNYDIFEDRAISLLARWRKCLETNPQCDSSYAIKGFLQEINDDYTKQLILSGEMSESTIFTGKQGTGKQSSVENKSKFNMVISKDLSGSSGELTRITETEGCAECRLLNEIFEDSSGELFNLIKEGIPSHEKVLCILLTHIMLSGKYKAYLSLKGERYYPLKGCFYEVPNIYLSDSDVNEGKPARLVENIVSLFINKGKDTDDITISYKTQDGKEGKIIAIKNRLH